MRLRSPAIEQWLIKFDGVTEGRGGPAVKEDIRPGPFGRIEYAYSRMARAAGIDVPETHLLREREYAHFMVRRFDRGVDDPVSRIHLHSLGGLQHVDYNLRGAFSYEEYFRTLRLLQLGQPAVDEAFRRMAFNLAAANQDDHVKNFAFLMTSEGKWHLSPAYDLTFAKGNAWTRTHQMTLNGKDDGFVRADLIDVGRTMDVLSRRSRHHRRRSTLRSICGTVKRRRSRFPSAGSTTFAPSSGGSSRRLSASGRARRRRAPRGRRGRC